MADEAKTVEATEATNPEADATAQELKALRSELAELKAQLSQRQSALTDEEEIERLWKQSSEQETPQKETETQEDNAALKATQAELNALRQDLAQERFDRKRATINKEMTAKFPDWMELEANIWKYALAHKDVEAEDVYALVKGRTKGWDSLTKKELKQAAEAADKGGEAKAAKAEADRASRAKPSGMGQTAVAGSDAPVSYEEAIREALDKAEQEAAAKAE